MEVLFNAQFNQDLQDIVAGKYTVIIEDANHCTITKERTILSLTNSQ
jgi:hypothetical protein